MVLLGHWPATARAYWAGTPESVSTNTRRFCTCLLYTSFGNAGHEIKLKLLQTRAYDGMTDLIYTRRSED